MVGRGATAVNVKFSWKAPTIGDVTLNMQNYIDMILPVYRWDRRWCLWLLGRKT